MEQQNLDSEALGISNPYQYLPPLQTHYRINNSTKKAKNLSTKEKAKKRRVKRKAQRHNR